jgi:hypothetical protein
MLLIVVVLAAGAAWMFRYEPMDSHTVGIALVWDRWTHEACFISKAGRVCY